MIDLIVVAMRCKEAGDAHPGHDLRIGVTLTVTPAFPDVGARLVPDFLEMLDDGGFNFDDARCTLYTGLGQYVEAVHQLAEDVELRLARGGIADADRRRTLIAGSPVQLVFRQAV